MFKDKVFETEDDEDFGQFRQAAERTEHPEISPPEIRIQSKKRKTFKDIAQKIDEVKAIDTQLARKKLKVARQTASVQQDKRRGLMTAQLGSIYEQREDEPTESQISQATTMACSNSTHSQVKNFRHF